MRTAENDGTAKLSGTHGKHFCCSVNNLVKRQNGKIPGHKFDDRPGAVHGSTYAYARKSEFCNRSVYHPSGTKLGQHTLTYFISAIIFSHFFSHQENRFIPSHLFTHGFPQCFAKSYLSHNLY